MSSNTLEPGEIRVGWIHYKKSNGSETPLPSVLRNEDGKTLLIIPLSPDEPDAILRKWFTGRSIWTKEDPDFSKYDYEPPQSIIFADSRGKVGLFRCHSLGYRELLGGAGEGRISVGFAVFGANTFTYETPTHLRTFIPGMGKWTGMQTIQVDTTYDSDGLGDSLVIRTKNINPVQLKPGVMLKTSWSTRQRIEDNWYQVQDPPFIESVFDEGVGFDEHLSAHGAFLDLVDIAYWKPAGYSRVLCYVEGDDALGIAKQWREVQTNYVRQQAEVDKRRENPLFSFSEIGAEGYQKWVELRSRMSKAIAPLMTLLDLKGSLIETKFVQSCMGLEGIGVQLLRDDGNYNSKKHSLKKRLQRIADEIGFSFSNDWAERTASLYNDIKHYDRDAVIDPIVIRNRLLENQLMFRSWAAIQIGIEPSVVEERIQYTSDAQLLVGEPGIFFKNYSR